MNWKVKRGEIVFLFLFFFRLSQKIKVSKVELNLNVDRQNEIFQSVGKVEKGKRKRRVYRKIFPYMLRAWKFKLLLILSGMFPLSYVYKHRKISVY